MRYDFDALKNYEEFKDLKEESYETIKRYGKIYNVPNHGSVLYEKHETDYVYYVLSGIVSVYKMNETGKRKVVFMFGKGKYLNEDYQENLNSIMSAKAFEDSVLLSIPKDIFYQLMENDVQFMKHVYASLSNKVRRMFRQLNNTEARLDKKIASKLYKLAKDYGIKRDDGILINMNLSVTYLSDLLGAQRESVSRALKTLVNENLIEYEKKTFLIKDMKSLSDYFKKSK